MLLPIGIGSVASVVLVIVLFKLMWRIAEPNEAMIVSGLRDHSGESSSLGFKIVTGRGSFVIPGVQAVRRLNLDLRQAELGVECVTHQGIPVGVRGVVIYKVGDDYVSIANSARRFLDQQNEMDQRVHNVFAGHLRAIVGQMTIEEMIRDREKLTQLTRAASGTEMEKLGLIVDSLQIQEIDDPTNYIVHLGRPHAAAVERNARIASADADREATQKEQEAEALKAAARRDARLKQASYQAEMDRAAAHMRQAGPLAEATAHQQVVVEETKVAELEAQREEKRLEAAVRKPADAKAYERTALAKAEREAHVLSAEAQAREVELLGLAEADARRAKGLADGDAVRAKGLAEAEAIKARADALSENQDAVIGQQLAQNWPSIVEAAAKPFGGIDQLIVLNGAKGLSDALAQALSQGVAGLQIARGLLSGGNGGGNGGAEGNEEPPPAVGVATPEVGDGAETPPRHGTRATN